MTIEEAPTFESLGLIPELSQACIDLKYTAPTEIQAQAIPHALAGKDIIGLAQTGSGKTAAFVLPILQALMNMEIAASSKVGFACVLVPTRELAYQIAENFKALGSIIEVKVVTTVGGVDMMSQSIALAKKPHVIVASPGRLLDHLENTKGFNLSNLKYLVLDEADRLLNMDFGESIDKILSAIPRERNTYLYSATMTEKVQKLQRASLRKPVNVSVSDKHSTVDTLLQYYLLTPAEHKETYLVHILNELTGNSVIIFVNTCADAQKIALMLREMRFSAVPLHGDMQQAQRLGALNKFKAGERSILVATDVIARGLDVPSVDLVINYNLPQSSKEYIHRVGRTARAGRSGRAISIVSQYDIELYRRIEKVLDEKLPVWPSDKGVVMGLKDMASEASRTATEQMKLAAGKGKGKGRGSYKRVRGGADEKQDKDDQDRSDKPNRKYSKR